MTDQEPAEEANVVEDRGSETPSNELEAMGMTSSTPRLDGHEAERRADRDHGQGDQHVKHQGGRP